MATPLDGYFIQQEQAILAELKPAATLDLPGIFACLRAFKNTGPHKR
ncbi:MAG: hypothetical protein GX608_02130 [Lentisphaerae bacterium]|nr:hypothetical protein [Lentisphaerota bacterium]